MGFPNSSLCSLLWQLSMLYLSAISCKPAIRRTCRTGWRRWTGPVRSRWVAWCSSLVLLRPALGPSMSARRSCAFPPCCALLLRCLPGPTRGAAVVVAGLSPAPGQVHARLASLACGLVPRLHGEAQRSAGGSWSQLCFRRTPRSAAGCSGCDRELQLPKAPCSQGSVSRSPGRPRESRARAQTPRGRRAVLPARGAGRVWIRGIGAASRGGRAGGAAF